MASIGFLILPGFGHLNPSLSLATELRSRGHRIVFYNVEYFRELIETLEFEFVGVGLRVVDYAKIRTRVPLTASPVSTNPDSRGASLFRNLSLARSVPLHTTKAAALTRALKIYSSFRTMIEVTLGEIPPMVTKAGAKLLVVDQSICSGSTISDLTGIPFVTLCNALHFYRDEHNHLPPFFVGWRFRHPTFMVRARNRMGFLLFDLISCPFLAHLNRWRRRFGLWSYRSLDDTLSSLAQISQLPAELEYPCHPDGHLLRLVGPLFDAEQRERQDDLLGEELPFDGLQNEPLVYATLGTSANADIKVYQRIVRAFRGVKARLVLNLGGRGVREELRGLVDNAVIVPHAPQVRLIKMSCLVITHGGLNTVLESLKLGKPLLAIPLEADQHGIAARMVRAKVAKTIPLRRLSEESLRACIDEMLTAPSYSERARAIGIALSKQSGAKAAADIVEEVLGNGRGTRPKAH